MKKALASLLVVPAVCTLLTACSSNKEDGRSERETAEKYIAALNARDPEGLIALKGPNKPGETGVEADANKLITENGGQGLKIANIEVRKDFEPDYASVHVTGTAASGKSFSIYITMGKQGGDWIIGLGQDPIKGTPKAPSSS